MCPMISFCFKGSDYYRIISGLMGVCVLMALTGFNGEGKKDIEERK